MARAVGIDLGTTNSVVSVLEGGYGNYEATRDTESGYTVSRAGLAENVGAHLSALAGVNPR